MLKKQYADNLILKKKYKHMNRALASSAKPNTHVKVMTHRKMIIDRWQRIALKGQLNSAQWQRLG